MRDRRRPRSPLISNLGLVRLTNHALITTSFPGKQLHRPNPIFATTPYDFACLFSNSLRSDCHGGCSSPERGGLQGHIRQGIPDLGCTLADSGRAQSPTISTFQPLFSVSQPSLFPRTPHSRHILLKHGHRKGYDHLENQQRTLRYPIIPGRDGPSCSFKLPNNDRLQFWSAFYNELSEPCRER